LPPLDKKNKTFFTKSVFKLCEKQYFNEISCFSIKNIFWSKFQGYLKQLLVKIAIGVAYYFSKM
jgi:hypothetical protein